jgi:hypothetical protein
MDYIASKSRVFLNAEFDSWMDRRLLKVLYQLQRLFSVVDKDIIAFDELEMNWEEVLVAYSKVLSNNSPAKTEENNDK